MRPEKGGFSFSSKAGAIKERGLPNGMLETNRMRKKSVYWCFWGFFWAFFRYDSGVPFVQVSEDSSTFQVS